jgi:hypothetical protein
MKPMKTQENILFVLFLTAIFVNCYATNIEYNVSNFPDSITNSSTVSFTLTISNVSNKDIDLRELPNPIEICIKKANSSTLYEQKVITNVDFIAVHLKEHDKISKDIAFSTLFQKDTIVCPPSPNYSGCRTKQDSILAGIIGLCTKVNIDKPFQKGIYNVIIYVNITEQSDKQSYHRIVRKLKIL